MDFISQFLSDHGPQLIRTLVGQAGFSTEQAQGFVPAAVTRLVGALQGGGAGGGFDLGALMEQVDVDGLASEAGVEPPKARAGLESVAPALLGALKERSGGAGDLLSALGGGSGAGGLLGKAGGLVGKLFK